MIDRLETASLLLNEGEHAWILFGGKGGTEGVTKSIRHLIYDECNIAICPPRWEAKWKRWLLAN